MCKCMNYSFKKGEPMNNRVRILGLQTTLSATLASCFDVLQEHYTKFKDFSNRVIVSVEEEEEMTNMLNTLEDYLEELRELREFHSARTMQLIDQNDFDPGDMVEMLENVSQFVPEGKVLDSDLKSLVTMMKATDMLTKLMKDLKEDDTPEMGFMESYLCGEEEDVNWLDKLLQLVDAEFDIYLVKGPTLPLPDMFQARGLSFMPMTKVKSLVPVGKSSLVITAFNKFAKRMKELQNILGIDLETMESGKSEEAIEKQVKKRFEKFCKKYQKEYDAPLKNVLKSYLAELRGI